MVNIFLNVAGLLDPVEMKVSEQYEQSAIVNVDSETLKSYIGTEPFFSDRWLLRISDREFCKKGVAHMLLGSETVDVLVYSERMDSFARSISVASKEILDIKNAIAMRNMKFNKFLESKPLIENLSWYVDTHLSCTPHNAYKLSMKYHIAYLKMKLFNLSDLKTASKTIINPTLEHRIYSIAQRIKGNEKTLKTMIDFRGTDMLSQEFYLELDKTFPRPKYVTVNNYAFYVLLKDEGSKRDVYNIIYNYRGKPERLYNAMIELFDKYHEIYSEYITGELTFRNQALWMQKRGNHYNIKSEFQLKRWMHLLDTISLERITMYKFHLQQAHASGDEATYHAIVTLVDSIY